MDPCEWMPDHGQIGLERLSAEWLKPTHSRSSSTASSRHSRQNTKDWEVMDNLQGHCGAGGESLRATSPPGNCDGYLMKKRKWPLKGWHKSSKGKLNGSMDVSLAVMSVNKKARRIDLDTGDSLYHIKAMDYDLYYIWVTKLSAHRMYKRNEAAHVHNSLLRALSHGSNVLQKNDAMQDVSMSGSYRGETADQSEDMHVADTSVNRKVCAWLQQAQDHDNCTQELNRCQMELNDLNRMVQKLHTLEFGKAVSNGELKRIISMQFSSSHLGASVPSIPEYVYTQLTPSTTSRTTESTKLYQDICTISQRVHASLKSVHEALFQERQRLQDTWSSSELRQNTSAQINGICSTLTESESICRSSVAGSVAEYFDACDEIYSFSEASDESGLSEASSISEPEEDRVTITRKYRASLSKASSKPIRILGSTGNRTKLPVVCPDNSHVGLITILYNNIGKDLSHVSMPAALNEPVNLLQRLCEELEYSELLDTANHTDDPYQRMVYIAAFAISGYSTAQYRNRYKPFNPVLGETFECVREDRGFRYISEQVCHHPPISACHAVSDNFCFWQDQRWKNKFWGKSLEIMPTGMVNVTLSRYGDHYEWNKVVTCIHNVLSQQRYLEHYGEVTIRNLNSSVCTCKITFVKSRYWGSDTNKNEVQGQVLDQSGNVVHRFGGFWHEGIFCDTVPNPHCIWKPYPQPKDSILYYGFSSFAMEMNELTPELKTLLPPTDTRLRPDQRMLEEGRVEEADKKKDEVEEKQRERRKILAKREEQHIPRFFRKSVVAAGKEVWLTNGTYWKLRENPGFANIKNLELW
ncbi:Oxysterol-binding protein-related protein 6 [Bagarius yarrelli]|uniref:Oxysterol-binding protein n=1 Tax=Bagarius yarrelli TaxID=175774 RepID=A0A556TJ17_BAGYA|nr:Oxysterol-binding protein-related protein 6 [Bagarius yarrelli]